MGRHKHRSARRVPGRGMLVFVGLLLALALPRPAAAKSNPFKSIERKYHIDILWDTLPFPLRVNKRLLNGERADEKQAKAAADLLRQELRFYSKDILQRLGLRRIVVAVNLTVDERRIGGLAVYQEYTFYLDAENILSREDRVRQTFHHELFHMFDYRDDRRISRDSTWEGLNPPSFHYGSGGYEMLNDPRAGLLTDKYPGFITRYSTAAVAEDKAEIYSHMVTHYALMQEIAKTDAVVRAKMKALMALLERFHPLMNERFWQQFEKGMPLGTPAGLKAVIELITRAETAVEHGRLFEAYRSYERAERVAQRKLNGKDQAIYTPRITTGLGMIYTVVAAPLEAAEKALRENNARAAVTALETFEQKFESFTDVLEFRNRHNDLIRNEAVRQEKRERVTRKKIAAGDAAVRRGDYRRAQEWYNSAARVFKETEAAGVAQARLDQMLANPEIKKNIEEQTAKLECTALLGRARMLIDHDQHDEASAVCGEIMAKYPGTEWAEEARQLKAEAAPGD